MTSRRDITGLVNGFRESREQQALIQNGTRPGKHTKNY